MVDTHQTARGRQGGGSFRSSLREAYHLKRVVHTRHTLRVLDENNSPYPSSLELSGSKPSAGTAAAAAAAAAVLCVVMWSREGSASVRLPHQSGAGPTLVRHPHEKRYQAKRQEIFTALKWDPALKRYSTEARTRGRRAHTSATAGLKKRDQVRDRRFLPRSSGIPHSKAPH